MLGYSQQELCRMNHRDFAAPEYHDTITAHLKKTIEQGAREGYECEWIARDGHRIPLEINSTARYSESGTFQVTRCIVRDISARQVLERRLVESERLRAIGEVAAGVAHNFNNLLTAILFRVRSIENASHDAASVARDAKAIEVALQDASAMIQRLQVSSGRPASDVSRVDVDRLVLEVIDTTRPQWDDIPLREGRNIEVKTDLESGQSILGDPTELREVFTNLILNGVDALPEGGEITIKTAPQVAHVVLSVSDSGGPRQAGGPPLRTCRCSSERSGSCARQAGHGARRYVRRFPPPLSRPYQSSGASRPTRWHRAHTRTRNALRNRRPG